MQVPSATEVTRFMSKDLAESVLTITTREPLSPRQWKMKNQNSIGDAYHDALRMTAMITKVAGR
ncbi:hypothetical protein BTUL_0219g00190 [Botrytis tulipae]|uniref:Uncharacterized protein n=1 Tax=Botrytis tulipae TaxID=87230 RepID=A0A4Z1EA04_9HELO|nr:hypothetical protein BTUL_0219g00190 [Botrytis tulipae]